MVDNILEIAPKARRIAKPETATDPSGDVAECGSSIFFQLTSLENLHQCWLKAKRNKGNRFRVQKFGEDPLRHLLTIQQRLRSGNYTFGPYKTFTIKEKKWRDVIDAPMKDRIVHWMLYHYLLPIWQPQFIFDSYGNLPHKGSHAAVMRLSDFCRKKDTQWVLQIDISKYFYSIPHNLLEQQALRNIGDTHLRALIQSLISSFVTDDRYDNLFHECSAYRLTANKGMPIGNLPSQLFANIYLNPFDHWIKETLRLPYYIRYVDDLVILGRSRSDMQLILSLLCKSLAALGLTVHPHKIRIAPTSAGIPFLGYVVWPNHISAGKRLRQRYYYRLREHESCIDRAQALNSYFSALKHTGSTIS